MQGVGLDPVELVSAADPPPPIPFITDHSKAVLLLWFLSVICSFFRLL